MRLSPRSDTFLPGSRAQSGTLVPSMKVSVLIITFNHVKYIAQAIESALMQNTDFEYEIVIGDDCSTDGTWEIVDSFRARYPEKIVCLQRTNRLGAAPNFIRTLEACRGDYIAIVEGDDFWTCPQKLAKQVQFLDTYRDYAFVFHNMLVMSEVGSQKPYLLCPFDQNERTTISDLIRSNYIGTASVMFRRNLFGICPNWMRELAFADWPLHILNAQYGKIGYLSEPMAVYRIHSSGLWSQSNRVWQLEQFVKLYDCLEVHLAPRYVGLVRAARFHVWYALFIEQNKQNVFQKARRYALKCLTYWPPYCFPRERGQLLFRLCAPEMFEYAAGMWRNWKIRGRAEGL